MLRHNAAAVLLAHNHPSGDPEPSRADLEITGRLLSALGLIDVRVLDHVTSRNHAARCCPRLRLSPGKLSSVPEKSASPRTPLASIAVTSRLPARTVAPKAS